jgi:glycosyltransferase A (GT-A) superfamily protein (DUF2064 family)
LIFNENPNLNTTFTQTCVLYFTSGANSSKCFSSKKKKNRAIQKVLFDNTLLEIRKTKLNYLVSDGNLNTGSFYEKINSAVTKAFSLGYKQIILVGDDTPQLSAKQILKAAQNLITDQLSIGPSEDGGAYLIAFDQSHFEDGLLQNLSWQTPEFYKALVNNIFLKKYSYETFSKFSDLDNAIDIENYLRKFSYLKFTQTLKNICVLIINQTTSVFLIEKGYHSSLPHRGPPVAA